MLRLDSLQPLLSSLSLCLYMSLYLSISLSISLSLYLSISLSLYLSISRLRGPMRRQQPTLVFSIADRIAPHMLVTQLHDQKMELVETHSIGRNVSGQRKMHRML